MSEISAMTRILSEIGNFRAPLKTPKFDFDIKKGDISTMVKRYKRHRDYGFFDQEIRLSKLSELGDPLKRLNQGLDFELFRELLEASLHKNPKGRSYGY